MAEAEAVSVHCCPICDFTTSTLAQWFSHLRAAHSSDPSFHVTCGIDGCQRTYVKFSSLNTHVYRHHRERMCEVSQGLSTFDSGAPSTQSDSNALGPFLANCFDSSGDSTELSTLSDIKKSSAHFLLELREGRGLSQVAIDSVVVGCERILDASLADLKRDMLSRVGAADRAECDCLNASDIEDAFRQHLHPFEGLRNKYQQEKFYVEEFHMIVSHNES